VPLRLPVRYFENVYAGAEDPWDFETSWYEQRKYALTLAALPKRRYRRVFEPGCSNGALTRALAERCDELVALEPVASVAGRAADRLAPQPHVAVRVGVIPDDWPEGRFDLVVLSEVGYYLTSAGLDAVADRLPATLDTGGHVVAVHWTGPTDYPLPGRDVHDRLLAHPGLRRLAHHEDERFVLTTFELA
jgi:SAM-dependent methyltransferase